MNLFLNLCSVANVIHHDLAALVGHLLGDYFEILSDLLALLVGLYGVLDIRGEGTPPVLRADQGNGVGLKQPLEKLVSGLKMW
jgi:hypothetical protein